MDNQDLDGFAPAPLIGVVDDDHCNRTILAWLLEDEGYRTCQAEDGERGLRMVREQRPDVLLLDVMMPGLDGFEVCRRLRAEPDTVDLPVIMLTALNRSDDKVRGLDIGADAFLTKPIEHAEVLAHVRTHRRIKRLREEVMRSREELVEQNRKLRALETMRRDLTNMLVHDLKSPLTAVRLGLECLAATAPGEPIGTVAQLIGSVNEASARLQTMIQNLLDLARLEEARYPLRRARLPLHDLVAELERQFTQTTARPPQRQRLVNAVSPALAASGDAQLVSRILENLIANACQHSPGPGEVRVDASAEADGAVVVTVADRGVGIPAHLREAVFDKFRTSEVKRAGETRNHGLGLSFVKQAVEAHGGRVWVEPRDGGGSRFRFRLPQVESEPAVRPPGHLAGVDRPELVPADA